MKVKKQLSFEEWAKIENRKNFWRDLFSSPYRFYCYLNPPKIEYSNIPKYGDVFTFEEFQADCFCYGFIDSDGCGFYATKDKETNIPARPSDIMVGKIREEFTHVVWYNK